VSSDNPTPKTQGRQILSLITLGTRDRPLDVAISQLTPGLIRLGAGLERELTCVLLVRWEDLLAAVDAHRAWRSRT
jgi:hypothetical protein